MLSIDLAMQGETSAFIEARAREYDRNMSVAIVCGILALCGALGVTGVLITHRVVGPAYKLKRLFQHVIDGHLRLEGRLRKGDELQDVFEAYERMIETLRERQRAQIGAVEEVIGLSRSSGASAETLARLEQLRQELKVALD
jgi:methyl-accepting chemotaxis protein